MTGHIFYGAIPFVFRTAHIKFHHFNEYSDFTTNIDLDRSKTSGFILYLPRSQSGSELRIRRRKFRLFS